MRWAMDIWIAPGIAETNLAGAYFFQLRSWQSFAYTCPGAVSFLPCSTYYQSANVVTQW